MFQCLPRIFRRDRKMKVIGGAEMVL